MEVASILWILRLYALQKDSRYLEELPSHLASSQRELQRLRNPRSE